MYSLSGRLFPWNNGQKLKCKKYFRKCFKFFKAICTYTNAAVLLTRSAAPCIDNAKFWSRPLVRSFYRESQSIKSIWGNLATLEQTKVLQSWLLKTKFLTLSPRCQWHPGVKVSSLDTIISAKSQTNSKILLHINQGHSHRRVSLTDKLGYKSYYTGPLKIWREGKGLPSKKDKIKRIEQLVLTSQRTTRD